MAYANNIIPAQEYLPILDEVYRTASKTAVLDASRNNVRFLNATTVQIFKAATDGLGDYNRAAGYPTGSVTAAWETYTLTQDRGRALQIDVMDNADTLDLAWASLVPTFMREHVVPEIDAYRFAKLAGTSGITAATPADITVGTTDLPALIQNAEMVMGDDEVPAEGRILFVSEKAYAALKDKITRTTMNADGNINTAVETYDEMRIVRVPKSRFNTAINLNDAISAGETAGDYTIPTDGSSYPINFMIVHPSAVAQVVHHDLPRIFNPLINQSANAWRFDYRIVHDIFVMQNKVKGVYLHRAATANS